MSARLPGSRIPRSLNPYSRAGFGYHVNSFFQGAAGYLSDICYPFLKGEAEPASTFCAGVSIPSGVSSRVSPSMFTNLPGGKAA